MKSTFQRVLALILMVCLLVPMGASAAQATEDGHIINDPERLTQFTFPDNWSEEALKSCVGNGIMNGRGSDLAAGENTTRAETAALLVRLLGAESANPDLSRFTDADENAWYYAELSAAVELGIMNGVSSTMLAPNAAVTREQVFVLLSRAFGLYPENTNSYKRFADGSSCSRYARNAVSALAERGILTGYTDGTVRPKQSITRAELAKLLYELFTCVCDAAADLPASGSVLYRGSEPIPEGYTLDGTLTIGCGYQGEQTISALSVSGMLVLRPAAGCPVTLSGCTIETLSVPASMKVSGDTSVKWIISAGSGSEIDVPGGKCSVFADCTINADMGTVSCNTEGMTVTLNASVESCVINARNVTLVGTGSVRNLEVLASGCDAQVTVENRIEDPMKDPDNALNIVQTLVVWDTVTEDTYLYSNSGLTDRICALPTGTRLDHYYYRDGAAAASVYTEDGTFGYVDRNCIYIPEEADILDEPYTDEVMEAFVNQKGYTSSTDYLIWVSLKTQTVNVFTGGTGNWTLVKSMPCSSGKNATPTVRGQFTIQNHLWEWDFGTYKVRYVSVFYGGYAFHSRIYSRDYSELLDGTIGTPASDGCLRMLDEDCRYIMEQIPYNTRVVVY